MLKDILKLNNYIPKEIKYHIKKIKTFDDYIYVYLDEEKIEVSLENYFKYGLGKLEGFDDELYELLKEEEIYLKAYRSCIRKLSIKDYSIYQIRNHLNKYELNDVHINRIIDKLLELKLLDDNRYCLSRINYLNKQLYSYKQIVNKLVKEGISKYIINDNLVYDSSLEQNKCDQLCNKLNSKSVRRSRNSQIKYMISKLVNNGFSYSEAKNALDKVTINSDNEDILLRKEYEKALKKYSRKYNDYELKNKIYTYLLNKGFNIDDIKKVEVENG